MPFRSIDNLRVLLAGDRPAWIPFSLDVGTTDGMSVPIARQFREKTGAACPAEYFGTDLRRFSLGTCFGGNDPAALHPQVPPGTTFDEWGIGHWAGGLEGTLDRMYPPFAAARSRPTSRLCRRPRSTRTPTPRPSPVFMRPATRSSAMPEASTNGRGGSAAWNGS